MKQPGSHCVWSLISHAKQNDTRNGATAGCQELPEIEIARQDHPLLSYSLIEYPRVRHGMKAMLAKVNHFLSKLTQSVNGGHRNAHVGVKFHATGLENGWASSLTSADAYDSA